VELRLASFENALEPANDPTPALPCNNGLPLPPDAIALYFGNSRLSTPEFRFPWPVLYPQDRRLRKKHPIITLEKDKAGRIAIDFDVLSADHKIIARIERNRFVINGNNILTKQRPDCSTLIVVDQYGNEVLNIRYLNPHSIHLLGKFYVIGQKEPVEITDADQYMGNGMHFSWTCISYNRNVGTSLVTGGDGTGNHAIDKFTRHESGGNLQR
jgi:hypothetical protein